MGGSKALALKFLNFKKQLGLGCQVASIHLYWMGDPSSFSGYTVNWKVSEAAVVKPMLLKSESFAMTTDWAQKLAELLVGVFFFGVGIANTRSSAAIIESLRKRNFFAPQLLFWLGVSTQLFAGLMMVIGFQPALMAGVLIAFTLVAPLVFHAFWAMEGELRFLNRIIFLCDYTCVLAALVLIASSDTQAWLSLLNYVRQG